MKTRKRTLSEANSSCVTARVVTRNFVCSAEAPLLLRKHGYVRELTPNGTTDTLRIAVKAFQAQLDAWSKQATQHRHTGFRQLARKQRVEFRAGDSTLGQLGLLQSVAVTVQDLQSMAPWDNTDLQVCVTADCELRWCKPWMTLQEECWQA